MLRPLSLRDVEVQTPRSALSALLWASTLRGPRVVVYARRLKMWSHEDKTVLIRTILFLDLTSYLRLIFTEQSVSSMRYVQSTPYRATDKGLKCAQCSLYIAVNLCEYGVVSLETLAVICERQIDKPFNCYNFDGVCSFRVTMENGSLYSSALHHINTIG